MGVLAVKLGWEVGALQPTRAEHLVHRFMAEKENHAVRVALAWLYTPGLWARLRYLLEA